MKKILRLMIICTLITYFNVNLVSAAEEFSALKNTLEDLGISQEYSENITNYVKNLSVSQDELNTIVAESKDIMDAVGQKTNVDEFNFGELMNIYGQVMAIAKELDLNLSYSISNNEVTITDKKSNNVLFSGGISDLANYYSNLSQVAASTDIVQLGQEIASEIIANSSDSTQNINKQSDSDIDDLSDSSDELKSKQNSNTNNNQDSNNDNINKVNRENSTDNKLSSKSNLAISIASLIGGVLLIGLLFKIR